MNSQQPISDEYLISQVADGDMDALAQLVDLHQQRVVKLAYHMVGHWQEAEDVAQETFVRVYHAAERYRPEAKFTTWLFRVVVNLCHDARRRGQRSPISLGDHIAERLGIEHPDILEQQEKIQRVQQALGRLSQRQHTAVVLHRYEQMSHRQIAEVTGWSESAVESLIVRGYKKLRKLLIEFDEHH